MNNFIYKNKSLLLKIKRALNNTCGLEILKYPTPELDRRIKLLKNYNIDVIIDVGANIGQYGAELRNIGYEGKIISFEPPPNHIQEINLLGMNNIMKNMGFVCCDFSKGVLGTDREGKVNLVFEMLQPLDIEVYLSNFRHK